VGALAVGALGMSIRLRLPFDMVCSENERLIPQWGGKRFIISDEYRASKSFIHFSALGANTSRTSIQPDATTRWQMRIDVHFPDRRKRDASNYVKVIKDALEGVFYEDDHQVKRVDVAELEPFDGVVFVELSEWKGR
jgi:Holliday junction resolvase RusA-like endonuclease